MNKFDALSPMEDFNNNIAKIDTPKVRKRKKMLRIILSIANS